MKINSILLIAMSILTLSSCKKDKNEESTPATPSVNKLCDGNSSSSWMPLDSANSWSYSYTIGGIGQTSPTIIITGHSVRGGKTYAVTNDASYMMQTDDRLFREDASHNIYYYSDNDNAEYLEVPGTPTLNQSWAYGTGGYTRKVTNLSASFTTGSCSYTGLLEISYFNGSNQLQDKYYYKKGLGLVESTSSIFMVSTFAVSAVTLK